MDDKLVFEGLNDIKLEDVKSSLAVAIVEGEGFKKLSKTNRIAFLKELNDLSEDELMEFLSGQDELLEAIRRFDSTTKKVLQYGLAVVLGAGFATIPAVFLMALWRHYSDDCVTACGTQNMLCRRKCELGAVMKVIKQLETLKKKPGLSDRQKKKVDVKINKWQVKANRIKEEVKNLSSEYKVKIK